MSEIEITTEAHVYFRDPERALGTHYPGENPVRCHVGFEAGWLHVSLGSGTDEIVSVPTELVYRVQWTRH